MIEFTEFLFTQSTADDESGIFSGEKGTQPSRLEDPSPLPAGKYRVIDGKLVRVAPGIPPDL